MNKLFPNYSMDDFKIVYPHIGKSLLRKILWNIWLWLRIIIPMNDTWTLKPIFFQSFHWNNLICKLVCWSQVCNNHAMEVSPLQVNPIACLWHNLVNFKQMYKYFKLVENSHGQGYWSSVEDKCTFSTISFMKSKHKIQVHEHLLIVVGMISQDHYNLESFHHDWVFEEWHNSMKWCVVERHDVIHLVLCPNYEIFSWWQYAIAYTFIEDGILYKSNIQFFIFYLKKICMWFLNCLFLKFWFSF